VQSEAEGYQTVKIYDAVGHNEIGTVTLYSSADQPFLKKGWTLEEAALWTTTDVGSKGSAHNFIINRVAPKALDGCPANQDAELLSVPEPRFWEEEKKRRTYGQECTVILRARLDLSGQVTTVEKGPDDYHSCVNLDDIVDAGKRITFRPAMRDGNPITQTLSILYRTH
jgi:hypothetical protein